NGEESYYDMPGQSTEQATVYEHCVHALNHALRFGSHGLPLMGGGDWNDGMNLVGIGGKGESVWLGFFIYTILMDFQRIAIAKDDAIFAEKCAAAAKELQLNLADHAWDGEWYLRGFYDDGTPLGSSRNDECRIDAIAQSWAVLSGAASDKRSATALHSLNEILISRDTGLIRLLDPPFNVSKMEPGYIKGYPPGIRENGGQYTHAAVWAVMAFAKKHHVEKMKDLLHLLNPVYHGSSPDEIARYKVEPYVMAADIYSAYPYDGRGGWTWYTGSASWMYRLVIESIFGIQIEVDRMIFAPCIPREWDECTVHYRYRETVYHLVFHQYSPGLVTKVMCDDAEQIDLFVPLIDDRRDHYVRIEIGETRT
ncbi:MAG TPA: cyclic beta 1-2 glucan synthetase, partial [Spirochaetota bacterium]